MTPSSPSRSGRPARRRLAWGLVAYGLLGLSLVLVGGFIGVGLADRIERVASAADGTLAAAADSTRAAADSFTSVDRSLEGSEVATSAAAALSREAGATLSRLALAMQLSIFGAQPLLPLAEDFERSAEQAGEVATALDDVGASVGETRADASQIGVELDELADQLEDLRGAAEAPEAPPIRLFVLLLMAWVTVPAVGALFVGSSLLRGT